VREKMKAKKQQLFKRRLTGQTSSLNSSQKKNKKLEKREYRT
jgi:hypothetical protein